MRKGIRLRMKRTTIYAFTATLLLLGTNIASAFDFKMMPTSSPVKKVEPVEAKDTKTAKILFLDGSETGLNLATETDAGTGRKLYLFDRYVVEIKDHNVDVGSDITIRYRPSGKSKNFLKIITESSRWASYSPDDIGINRPNDAAYFLGIFDHWLIVDSGTGPDPRGLSIYDLNTKKKIYDGSYSEPIYISHGKLIFWTEIGKADENNCPHFKEWLHNYGGTPAIDGKVEFDFKFLTLQHLSEEKCNPRQ
jgi:hypothetical protein